MSTIELASHNAYGLALRSPVIVAPGCAGVVQPRDLDPAAVGAVTTRTAVLHAARDGRVGWGTVPAGVVFERLPTVSLRALVQTEARRWLRSPVPVILSLYGTPDELVAMVTQLETVEGIAGLLVHIVVVGGPDALVAPLAAIRAQTALPLLVLLPHVQPAVSVETTLEVVAPQLVAAGADALVCASYPLGCAAIDGRVIEGVLVGPTLAPWTLRSLAIVASAVSVPLVALGGVADAALAQQCLAAGASALLIDGALYGDLAAAQQIGAALQRDMTSAAPNV